MTRTLTAIAMLLAASPAHAGTCRTFADGANSVEECRDGDAVTGYTVTGPDGRTRTYGEPNAGFERYPGQPEPPIYERRER